MKTRKTPTESLFVAPKPTKSPNADPKRNPNSVRTKSSSSTNNDKANSNVQRCAVSRQISSVKDSENLTKIRNKIFSRSTRPNVKTSSFVRPTDKAFRAFPVTVSANEDSNRKFQQNFPFQKLPINKNLVFWPRFSFRLIEKQKVPFFFSRTTSSPTQFSTDST